MKVRYELVLLFLALVSLSSARAQTAHGWFVSDCYGVTFHLAQFSGRSNSQEIMLRFYANGILWEDLPLSRGWVDVSKCTTIRHCEKSSQAKMRFRKLNGNVLSGRYEVDIKERRLQGNLLSKQGQARASADDGMESVLDPVHLS